ncbi:hypothetical protein [Chryseobacterium sp. POE27]|uniref:hypothetical protein n=1 Tax=Chryseobacterium sp. POE27 TaxID=3138177 RepID=UPI00321BB0B0
MGRSYSALILIIVVSNFICCGSAEEYPDDLPDYHISLNEAVGDYIYIPKKILNIKEMISNILILKKEIH